jgi:hypothetical protein
MNLLSVILGIGIGLINILMNILVKRATEIENRSYFNSLLSYEFLYAFFIGILSITLIFTFYYYSDKFNFTQALILMGASSICVGSLYGYFFKNNPLSFTDITVLIVIISSYSYKYFSTNN